MEMKENVKAEVHQLNNKRSARPTDGRALLFYPKIMRAENGRFIVQSTLITA